MPVALRVVTLVVASAALVLVTARTLRTWLALLILGTAVVLLVPEPRPWVPLAGGLLALSGVCGLVRGAVLLVRIPRLR